MKNLLVNQTVETTLSLKDLIQAIRSQGPLKIS